MQRMDLVGKKYGMLEVVEYAGVDPYHNTLWKCRCGCGGERIVKGAELKNNSVTSCGCVDGRNKDISKQRFGRLVAIRLDHIKGNRYIWLFKCDCGNHVLIDRASAVTGNTKSCGCLLIEEAVRRARKNTVLVDAEGKALQGEIK